jgi:glycosyltransferase involved in cell wall biosynthesis
VVTVVSQPASPVTLRADIRSLLKTGRRAHRWSQAPFLDFLGPRHIVLPEPRPVCAEDVPDADVVIATWWETVEWVDRFPPEKGRKVHLMQGYEMFPEQPQDRVAATYRLDFERIAVSNYVRDEVLNNHGPDSRIIMNSVDLAHFCAPARGRNPRFTVGFLYQAMHSKNLPRALAAIAEARRRFPDLQVLSFGDSTPFAEWPLPEGCGYQQAPDQAAIPGLYASCDAWLFTSDAEGFGLPILEAMACRTPVIATRAGAAEQLIEDGVNGYLVAGDAMAFADRLEAMRAMPEADWVAMSAAARARVESWSWDDAADAFEAVLTEITSR